MVGINNSSSVCEVHWKLRSTLIEVLEVCNGAKIYLDG